MAPAETRRVHPVTPIRSCHGNQILLRRTGSTSLAVGPDDPAATMALGADSAGRYACVVSQLDNETARLLRVGLRTSGV